MRPLSVPSAGLSRRAGCETADVEVCGTQKPPLTGWFASGSKQKARDRKAARRRKKMSS